MGGISTTGLKEGGCSKDRICLYVSDRADRVSLPCSRDSARARTRAAIAPWFKRNKDDYKAHGQRRCRAGGPCGKKVLPVMA